MNEDQDTSGWTFVKPKKASAKRTGNVQTRHNAPLPAIPAPSKDMTAAKCKIHYQNSMQTWKSSTCRKQLIKTLDRLRDSDFATPQDEEDSGAPDGRLTILDAHMLGSGSFSRDNLEQRGRSMLQLAVFMDLSSVLPTEGNLALKLYSQEPKYTDIDKEFLSELGVAVVDGGLERTFSGTTFVCELFLEKSPTFLRTVLDAQVPLVVGSMRVDEKALLDAVQGLSKDDTSENAQYLRLNAQFCKQYQAYFLPEYEEDLNVLLGLKVATRRPLSENTT